MEVPIERLKDSTSDHKSWKSWKLYKTVFKALLQHFLDTKSSISYSFHNFHDFHGLGETLWDALCRLP